MKRHVVALAVVMLTFPVARPHAADVPRPNILFILADDLGWADTTLNGHTKLYRTPNLERLAKRGMMFTRAYSASPLCSPTRSAVMTGLSPARTGITIPNGHMPQTVLEATPGRAAPPDKKSIPPVPPTRLKTEYRTLAEALKEAGYVTGHFGKWHLGPEPYSPRQQGFDVDVPHWPGPSPAGSYVAPWKFPNFTPDPGAPHQHIEDRMAREAVAFLEKHKDEPFYLNYWMFSVHAPFNAKPGLVEKYRGRVDPHDPQRSPTYAAMVESMDDAVGTLLDTLDRLGIADRTFIVFTSDNGGNMYDTVDGTTPTSNAPLRGGKATLFEGGIRVPCVVAGPGIAPGSHSDVIIQSEDYYPTLLDALGLRAAPGQHFDGVSLLRAWKGERFDRGPVFHYFPHDPGVPDWLPPAITVHRGDWKLIRIFHGGDRGAHRYLLFNLHDDLGERNNRAAAKPELVAELDGLIEVFLADTRAVVPRPNPAFDPARYHPEDEGKPIRPTAAQAKAAARTPAGDDSDPKLQGWKARNCAATVDRGIVTVRGMRGAPFLGVGAGTDGPAVVSFHARSAGGGPGKVEWLMPSTTPDPAHTTPFTLAPGDWQTVTVKVPASGPIGILRIYLPAQRQPVEVDWIELKSPTRTRRWEF
jgi:arylsulfatase A-like enzyme